VQGFSGPSLKDHHRLALVADTEEGDLSAIFAAIQNGLTNRQGVLENLLRVMLDESRPRIMLRMLTRLPVENAAGDIDYERLGSGGALVD